MRIAIIAAIFFALPAIGWADEEVSQQEAATASAVEPAAVQSVEAKPEQAETKPAEPIEAKSASVSVCAEKTRGATKLIGGILSFVGGAVAAFTPLGGAANMAAFAVDVGGGVMKAVCR